MDNTMCCVEEVAKTCNAAPVEGAKRGFGKSASGVQGQRLGAVSGEPPEFEDTW